MILYILSVFALFEAAQAVATVTVKPTNVTVKMGEDAKIPCGVTNLGIEGVEWKQPNGSVVASKSTVTDSNKYKVEGTYNLIILKTTKADAGPYTCIVSTDNYIGYLTVNGVSLTTCNSILMVILLTGAMLVIRR